MLIICLLLGFRGKWFVLHPAPWFVRGTTIARGLNAGVFAFTNGSAFLGGGASFRATLL
jgi:hypothetical protein